MSHLQVLDTGVVYRNPKPHLHSRHAYFPSLVHLPGGELVCGFDIGSAFEAVDVRSFTASSLDKGKTWSTLRSVFDPAELSKVSTSCRLSAPHGNLVGLACLMDRSREDEGLANPATEGFVRTEFEIVRRQADGTWQRKPVVPPLDWNAFEICSPIVQTPSGRWLLPTSLWPNWDGLNPLGPKAIAFVSEDRGLSWRRGVEVMARRDARIAFFEQKIIALTPAELMAVCWTIDLRAKHNLPIHFSLSDDDGNSFAPPAATPLQGETCVPFPLGERHVLLVYRRTDRRGLWAQLAVVASNGWAIVEDLPLWGANVAAHDTHQESLMAQMSTLRFGCPTIAHLTDRDFLVAFWCVEDCVSVIRWIRLAVN